jgi:hypothetical protein
MLPETFRLAGARPDLARLHHAVVVRVIIDGDKFLAATIAAIGLELFAAPPRAMVAEPDDAVLRDVDVQAVSLPMCGRAGGAAMRAGRVEVVAELARRRLYAVFGQDLVGGLHAAPPQISK